MDSKPGIPILVTGFGPFGVHKVNISWEIAKVLPSLNFESNGVSLEIQEIPVVYSIVSKEVPSLWKIHKPQLVVHLGVTSIGSQITLETIAHKNGYAKVDIFGRLPESGSAKGEKDILRTALDVQKVSDHINNSTDLQVPTKVSSDAGRYLCEFTFYTSLNINYSRTVFIHIPDFNKGYTVLQMAIVIKQIILLLLEEISKSSLKSEFSEKSLEVMSLTENLVEDIQF